MAHRSHKLFTLLVVLLACCAALGVSAQGESAGALVLGQPVISQIATAGETVTFDYTITAPKQVVLQALAESTPPTITILQDGAPVASEPNTGNAATISLEAFLNAGAYQVQVGATGDATGIIVLVLQSETDAPSTVLTPDSPISGVVSQAFPFALYSFDALSEPAYVYIESGLAEGGINARLVWAEDATVRGEMDDNVLGTRFRIPGNSAAYFIEVEVGDVEGDAPFTLCLTAVNVGGCETGSVPVPQATEEVVVLPVNEFCRVSPSTGSAVNIRQSASTQAAVVASLPLGSSADVIGISPDGAFYNVLFNGTNGWVALSVVASTGNCADVLVITPPTVIQQPTQPPVQPTNPPPTATPSGPCLITMTGDMLVYVQTTADPSYIYDQVRAGYQLIPVGRLADNSWWKTNYADSWVQLSLLNGVGYITGDCSNLPIVSG